jgi:hypothetical protein
VVFEKVAKLPQAKTNPQIKPALPKSNPVMMGAYQNPLLDLLCGTRPANVLPCLCNSA